MNGEVLLYVALPNLALISAVLVAFWRIVSRPVDLAVEPARRGDERLTVWGVTPLQWGLGIILGFHLLALLVPGSITAWNRAPVRLYLLEASGLALGLWALVGFGVLLYRYLFSSDSDEPIHWADAAVVTLVGVLIGSGIVIAVFYRFGSAWGTAILVPYLYEMVQGTADAALIADLPIAAQVHILSFFALLPVFPMSKYVSLLAVPYRYLREAAGSVRAAPGVPEAAGAASWRLGWGTAYAIAIVFLVAITVGTVWLPSKLMSMMGGIGEPIPSIVASAVWIGGFGAFVVALRWAQKTGRI